MPVDADFPASRLSENGWNYLQLQKFISKYDSYYCKWSIFVAINDTSMIKIGYLWLDPHCEDIEKEKEWMINFGCATIIEEQTEHEKLRPEWKRLTNLLNQGDELVLSKFSNAVRGARELSILLEICRMKRVRVISIRDKIDSTGELFPETKVSDVLDMLGALSLEALAMRRVASGKGKPKRKRRIHTLSSIEKLERNKMVVNMYKSGHTIDDIWKVSGFKSRSSIFRILNDVGVDLNRGNTKGPLKKRNNNQDE